MILFLYRPHTCNAGCGGVAAADGPLPFGDIAALAGATLITIGAIGYGIYETITAPTISISKVEEKEKIIDIPTPPTEPIFIYRYGGKNPGNLTPRNKDRFTGLSFSTIPLPGSAVTTIEAINATGILYAFRDSATHVCVRPVNGTVSDWINAGSDSVWTRALASIVVKII